MLTRFRTTTPIIWLIAAVSTAITLACPHHASSQAITGRPTFSAFDSHEIDTIDLSSNSILLNLPVYSKAGAIPYALTLYGNPYPLAVGGRWLPADLYFNSTVDGALYYTLGFNAQTVQCPGESYYTNEYYDFYIQTVDGTVHWLPSSDMTDMRYDGSGLSCITSTSLTDVVTDNTGLQVSIGGGDSLISIYTRSGMSVCCTNNIVDSNGNSISEGGTIDSLGLTIMAYGYGSKEDSTFTWTGENGSPEEVQITTNGLQYKSAFGCSGIQDYTMGETPPVNIAYPDGTNIAITYEATPGYSGDYTGRLGGITLREGGSITYSYIGSNNGMNCTYQTVPELKRTTTDGTTTYTLAYSPTSGSNYEATNTVVDNGGNATVYTFTGFTSTGTAAYPTTQALTEIQRYQAGTLISTDVYCYNTTFANCSFSAAPKAVVNLPVTEEVILHKIGGMSTTSATLIQYDKYGNVTGLSQYDFGATSSTTATTTVYGSWNGTTCVSIGGNIYDKPCDVLTLENGSTVAESRYMYDSHGNLLKLYVWNGSAWLSNATLNTYNANGTLSVAYDLNNNPTTYTYNSAAYADCGGCTSFPFPSSISRGGLTTSATWDGLGGVKLTDVDANGQTTTYEYYVPCPNWSPDPFWRVLSITDPLGNEVCKAYPSSSLPDTYVSSLTFNSGSSINHFSTTTDGYGRPANIQTQQGPQFSQYDTLTTAYGWSSSYRTVATSQPCSASLGGTCPTVHTRYFDLLGRLYQETTKSSGESNETLTHTYTQNNDLAVLGPAPSGDGENTKQVQNQYDGLGRLQYSCRIGNGSSTACGQNTGAANGVTDAYTYTSSSGSTEVLVQRGGSGGQTRGVFYDALGRVTEKFSPEAGISKYYYDSTVASISCSWLSSPNLAGRMALSVDANGNDICYSYDALGRVLQANANGTMCRHFYYDTSTGYSGTIPSGISIRNSSGRLEEAATDGCRNGTLITDEWFSYDGDGRLTDVWESTPYLLGLSTPTYYHTTASYFGNGAVNTLAGIPGFTTETYGLDGEGRLSAAAEGTNTMMRSVV